MLSDPEKRKRKEGNGRTEVELIGTKEVARNKVCRKKMWQIQCIAFDIYGLMTGWNRIIKK